MLQLAIAGAVAAGVVIVQVRRRGTLKRRVEQRGWRYLERDDELASTWRMPPFAHVRTPGDPEIELSRTVQVSEVATFTESGSTTHSMAVTEIERSGSEVVSSVTHHVVALHTRQQLPRTIARAGIDVYVLPSYEGLSRVREPVHRTRSGLVSILSEDPATARTLPFDRITNDLGIDARITVVTDGDWIYAYRPGKPHLHRIDSMMVVVQKLARAIRPTRWPGPDNPASYVYGAV